MSINGDGPRARVVVSLMLIDALMSTKETTRSLVMVPGLEPSESVQDPRKQGQPDMADAERVGPEQRWSIGAHSDVFPERQ